MIELNDILSQDLLTDLNKHTEAIDNLSQSIAKMGLSVKKSFFGV